MTDLVDAPDPAMSDTDRVEQVADTFVGLMRTFLKARNRLLAAAEQDVEWSARVILKTVQTEGPLRSGALAEAIRSDPSTVSRQVAALVREGLLERRADPEDGRAALLALTERANEVVAAHDQVRLDYFASMLADWSQQDLQMFAELLHRFTTDYDTASQLWINERPFTTTSRSGGTA